MRQLRWLLLGCALNATASAQVERIRDLVQSVAANASHQVQFKETRTGELLAAPAYFWGELTFDISRDVLTKVVEHPTQATISISPTTVSIVTGQRAFQFAAHSRPELSTLHTGLSALLRGDAATLQRHFELTLDEPFAAPNPTASPNRTLPKADQPEDGQPEDGQPEDGQPEDSQPDGNRPPAQGVAPNTAPSTGSWRLTLSARDERVRGRIAHIELRGTGAHLRAIVTTFPNGDRQEMDFRDTAR